MRTLSPIPYGSLFFAPMEGITDETFRKIILKLYPEWDYLACDFLRVPSAGRYPLKHLVRHLGKELFDHQWIKEKTIYQILTSHRSWTVQMVQDLEQLSIPWIDLNIGCPSNTVCKNGGGSFLLTDPIALRPLIRTIRDNFKGRFTTKIRLGYDHADHFEDIVKMLNDEGVEMITVHARTRDQMYQGRADWSYIRRAVEISQAPVIGNGDVWSVGDIDQMLQETGCHGVMVARGALQSPWMAQNHRQGRYEESDQEKFVRIKEFFREYRSALEENDISSRGLLKQSKSVSRYMLNGVQDGESLRRNLMLSQTVPEFFNIIEGL